MNNNNPAPQVPVPPAPAPAPSVVTLQRSNQSAPKPQAQSGLNKARDILLNNDRIISFGLTTRTFPRLYDFSQAVTTILVGLYARLFQSNWNQGFSSIVPGIGAAGVFNQCESYAICYIHSFLCDLYSSIREVAKNESPSIFLAQYLQEMPRTGHYYDHFLRLLFNMMHPVLCEKYLEETLYYPEFSLDMQRVHDNWFNLDNVRATDISTVRMHAISDTLNRSKSISTGALQFGTKRGNGSILTDFYPRDDEVKTHAASWLNMDNNYSDDSLTVMYIIATDMSTKRLGPTYESGPEADEDIRNFSDPPFHAEYMVIEDTDKLDLNAYFVDGQGNRVETYNEARNQEAEYVRMYNRTWFFYRKKVLQTLTAIDRFNAFKQIIEG